MRVPNEICVVVYHGVFGDLYLLIECVAEYFLYFVYYVLYEGTEKEKMRWGVNSFIAEFAMGR